MQRILSNPLLRQLCLTLTLTLFAVASLPVTVQADVQVYQKVLRSTAWVLAKNSSGTSSGTGVLVDAERKLVVTNFHVVGDARSAVVFFAEIKDGQPVVSRQHYLTNVRQLGIRGRVVAVDRKRDLALIELQKLPGDAQAIPLAEASIGPGESVQSIGNPGSSEALWVFTSGTVRSVYPKKFRTGSGEHDFKVVETQSPINSGDSGGPVVNQAGDLVAIAQAIAPNARLVSYCVDVSEVREMLAGPWKPAALPISDILTKAELEFTKHDAGHIEVQFDQDDKSKQSVFVSNDVEYYGQADVRKVWALALTSKEAPSAETTMKLLQQSARTKLGAWTVEQSQDGQYMILYCVKLDATASPLALKSSMEYVAQLTRIMSKELQPQKQAQDASQTLESWLKN